MPLTFDITNEQKIVGITVSPTTATGRPSSIEAGSLTVAIADGNPNASGMVEADGTVTLVSGDGDTGLGSTTFVISGDADLGSGIVTISDTALINVTGAQATNLGLSGGSVVPKV